MKKLILFLILSIFSFSIQAQKNEISLSYGMPSVEVWFSSVLWDLPETDYSNFQATNKGILGIAYAYYSTNEKWRFGLNVDYEMFELKGRSRGNYYYLKLFPKVDYFWSKKEDKFRFYSGIALGYSYEYIDFDNFYDDELFHYSDNKSRFAPNLTYLGMQYGKNWSVFAELNAPFRSMFNIGISHRF